MKYFGTVKSFDTIKGHGEIKPETGGDMLRFERNAFSWENNSVPFNQAAPEARSANAPIKAMI